MTRHHHIALMELDQAKMLERQLGAIYFLEPIKGDALCGFVCCPPDGMQYQRDTTPSASMSKYMSDEDLQGYLDEINSVLRSTNAPKFPCMLGHLPGFCYVAYCAIRRTSSLKAIVNRMNVQLIEKKARFDVARCKAPSTSACSVDETAQLLCLKSTEPALMGMQQMMMPNGMQMMPNGMQMQSYGMQMQPNGMQMQVMGGMGGMSMQQPMGGAQQVMPMQQQFGQAPMQQTPLGFVQAAPAQAAAPVQAAPVYKNSGTVSINSMHSVTFYLWCDGVGNVCCSYLL
jgi:hypothetical protein